MNLRLGSCINQPIEVNNFHSIDLQRFAKKGNKPESMENKIENQEHMFDYEK